MLRNTLLVLALLIAACSFAARTQKELMVHFPSDVSELNEEAEAALSEFLASVELDGDYTIVLRGHTDFDGSNGYNQQLANARAATVKAFLLEHGADPALITVEAFGEQRPIMDNATEEGKAENRRVQLIFEQQRYADIDELRAELTAGTVQRFQVDPRVASTVTGAKGMRVDFGAHAFVDADGAVINEPVQVQLTEAMDIDAMLGHSLSTRAGDRLLETGGMVKVEAFDAQGRPLELAQGSPMQVSVPKNVDRPDMQLFVSENGGDWVPVGQPARTSRPAMNAWNEVRFVEPAMPRMPYPAFSHPIYREDRTGKPHRPMDPVYPTEPTTPREESYQVNVRWWQFLGSRSRKQSAAMRYARALEDHDDRMVQYRKKVEQYEEECAAMPERLERYVAEQTTWSDRKARAYEQWRNEIFLPARRRYDSTYAEPIRAYNEAIGKWWQKRDSLYQIWRDERTKQLDAYALEAERSGQADIQGLGAYVFNASRLGWINCDRFYSVPETEKYVAQVADPDGTREDVFLVFRDIRCIVNMRPHEDGSYRFAGVPKQQPAEVFAYKVQNGRAMVCRTEVRPGERPKLRFTKSSFAEIRKMLRELENKG